MEKVKINKGLLPIFLLLSLTVFSFGINKVKAVSPFEFYIHIQYIDQYNSDFYDFLTDAQFDIIFLEDMYKWDNSAPQQLVITYTTGQWETLIDSITAISPSTIFYSTISTSSYPIKVSGATNRTNLANEVLDIWDTSASVLGISGFFDDSESYIGYIYEHLLYYQETNTLMEGEECAYVPFALTYHFEYLPEISPDFEFANYNGTLDGYYHHPLYGLDELKLGLNEDIGMESAYLAMHGTELNNQCVWFVDYYTEYESELSGIDYVGIWRFDRMYTPYGDINDRTAFLNLIDLYREDIPMPTPTASPTTPTPTPMQVSEDTSLATVCVLLLVCALAVSMVLGKIRL